mmetsp:Transcript_32693/g.84386  ORF Transcript_32693/g.84386 Transcript_32693/m.84386 type:complete len:146 (-) Transcript_32693:1190-1627(-)
MMELSFIGTPILPWFLLAASDMPFSNIRGFMVQGGDPTGKGKGGKSIWGGYFDDELREELKHDARGVLAMANRGPDTNGSQFFITYAKAGHLDGTYTVFGRVLHGFEVLDAMEKVAVDPKNRPLTPIVLKSVTIHANPIADIAIQ